MTRRFVLGTLGSPFGLKGFVKVRSLSGETAHLCRLKEAAVRQEGKEKVLTVEEAVASPQGAGVLLKFRGIDSPEEAKALTGAELLGGREDAAPLKDEEFYVEDLKGLAVFSPGDESAPSLGVITAVFEGGGGMLAEIRLPSGELRLVPFRREFFGDIDLEKGAARLLAPWILE